MINVHIKPVGKEGIFKIIDVDDGQDVAAAVEAAMQDYPDVHYTWEIQPKPKLTNDEIKHLCWRHIVSYFPADTQRNLAIAQSLGQLSEAQSATLTAGFAWINQCRAACKEHCKPPPAIADDLQWPIPPEDLAGLVSQF